MFKKLPAHLSSFHVIIKRKKRKQETSIKIFIKFSTSDNAFRVHEIIVIIVKETRLSRFYIMLYFFFYFISILYALTCHIIDAMLIIEINFSFGFI